MSYSRGMIMTQFQAWLAKNADLDPCQEAFSMFYNELNRETGWYEMLAELAFQIYHLQICVEGLLQEGSI